MSFANTTDEALSPSREEVYQVLLRSLKRRQGFGIVFVQCSPAEAKRLIPQLQADLSQKHIATLEINEPINNLYDLIAQRPDRNEVNILFIQGLEKSLEPYIEPGYGGEGDYYNLNTVPAILSHLNQRREFFRDHFRNICFVFILPAFAIKYFIRRAPDFFDWGAGIFEISSVVEKTVISHALARPRRPGSGDNKKFVETRKQVLPRFLDIELDIEPSDFKRSSHEELLLLAALNYYRKASESYKISGDIVKAATIFQFIGDTLQLIERHGDSVDAYREASNLFHQIGNFRDEAMTLAKLGNAYQSLGQYQDAIELLQHVLDIQRGIGDPYGEATFLASLGNVFQLMGDHEKAIGYFYLAVEIQGMIGYQYGKAASLNALGESFQASKNYEHALFYYDKAIELYQSLELDEATLYKLSLNRGNTLNNLGRLEEAIKSYSRAIEIDPTVYEAWFERGNALDQLGRLEEAIADYDKALEIQPDQYEALLYKASSYGWLGNNDLAFENLQNAIALGPDEVRAWARENPAFKSMQRDRRFQALVGNREPMEPEIN